MWAIAIRQKLKQIQQSQLWKKLCALIIAATLTFCLAACGGDRPAANKPKAAGGVAETSPPSEIQRLSGLFDKYQPQVSIISPKPDQIIEENKVGVRLDVRDLPVFKSVALGLGPHVHVALDNQDYKAAYDLSQPLFFENLTPGTHTLRAFASRPWHESFKNEGAYAQVTFHVYAKTGENTPTPQVPLLTYSRPVGQYGAEPILLDFYLKNAPLHLAALEDEGITDWEIRTTINGQSFTVDSWQPLYLKGFKPGKNWIRLELLDKQGNLIPNEFNSSVHVIDYQPGGQDTLARLVRGETIADIESIVDPNYTAKAVEPAPTVVTPITEPTTPVVPPIAVPSAAPTPTATPTATATPVENKLEKAAEPKVESSPQPTEKAEPVIILPPPAPVIKSEPKAIVEEAKPVIKTEPKSEPTKEPTSNVKQLDKPIEIEVKTPPKAQKVEKPAAPSFFESLQQRFKSAPTAPKTPVVTPAPAVKEVEPVVPKPLVKTKVQEEKTPETETKLPVAPKAKVEPKFLNRPTAKPELKPTLSPTFKTDTKTVAPKPEVSPTVKTESKSEPKVDIKQPAPVPTAKPAPRTLFKRQPLEKTVEKPTPKATPIPTASPDAAKAKEIPTAVPQPIAQPVKPIPPASNAPTESWQDRLKGLMQKAKSNASFDPPKRSIVKPVDQPTDKAIAVPETLSAPAE